MKKAFKKGFGYAVGSTLGTVLSMAVLYKIMVCTVEKKEGNTTESKTEVEE